MGLKLRIIKMVNEGFILRSEEATVKGNKKWKWEGKKFRMKIKSKKSPGSWVESPY